MRVLIAAAAAFLLLAAPSSAVPVVDSGGMIYRPDQPVLVQAERLPHGRAKVSSAAPGAVQDLVRRGTALVGKPYLYGGGHDADFGVGGRGYDCSGSVSYVLRKHLKRPLASGALMSYGKPGKGKWVTIYANSGHAFLVVAGLRFDTSSVDDPSGLDGPRWRPTIRSTAGFVARHPENL